MNGLIYSYLEILISAVWINDIYENELGIKYEFTRYLKGSCRFSYYPYFSFKYLQKDSFVRSISLKQSGSFAGCCKYD